DEQSDELRPERDRKHFSSDQERGRRAKSMPDSDAASGVKRQRKERVTSGTPARTPAWQSEGFPLSERPSSGKARDGRRGAGKQYRLGRTTRKNQARDFAATAPQHRSASGKPMATPVAQPRRTSTSNPSVGR